MELTLLELHVGDVTLTAGDEREGVDHADAEPESVAPARNAQHDESGLPRIVLALVPVFVVLGVAAGFLAARRFAERSSPPDEPVDIELETEAQ